jgi:hypothetical protein
LKCGLQPSTRQAGTQRWPEPAPAQIGIPDRGTGGPKRMEPRYETPDGDLSCFVGAEIDTYGRHMTGISSSSFFSFVAYRLQVCQYVWCGSSVRGRALITRHRQAYCQSGNRRARHPAPLEPELSIFRAKSGLCHTEKRPAALGRKILPTPVQWVELG